MRAPGDLGVSRSVMDAIERAETAITTAQWMTPYRLFRASTILRRSGWVPPPQRTYGGMLADHRARLRAFDDRMSSAEVQMLIFGSPSGWLLVSVTPLFLPVLLVRSLVRKRWRG